VELESRLARYENVHTPPSLRRGGNHKKVQKEGDKGKPGQKKGHKGLTRPAAKHDRQIDLTEDPCPDCGMKLGLPFSIESKVIEEIPEPQPITVTEYRICHYICPYCRREVVAEDKIIQTKVNPTFRTFTSKIGIFAAIDFPTIMFVFRSNKKYGKIELTLCGL